MFIQFTVKLLHTRIKQKHFRLKKKPKKKPLENKKNYKHTRF